MAVASTPVTRPWWWWAHDIIVGLLSGFGVGGVAGLFINRLFEDNIVVLICAILGAIAGVSALVLNHRRSERFFTLVVLASWVLLVLSAGFIALLAWAVATFE